jgi:replicative DNA helicase
MTEGKLQPQAIDEERAVLGALLIDREAIHNVNSILRPECFYNEANMKVFEAIQNLYMTGKPIDILTVVNRLRTMGEIDNVGGPYYVTQLTNRIASSANVVSHSLIVYECYMKRALIKMSTDIIFRAYSDQTVVGELIDFTEKTFTNLISNTGANSIQTSEDLFGEILERNDKIIENRNNNTTTGIDTGFKELNRITNGWQSSDLIILAARPGMGKTSLAIDFLKTPAFKKIPTAIFSLEMSSIQLYSRLVSQACDISVESVMRTGMNETQMKELLNKSDLLCDAPIYFDDTAGLKLSDFKTKARKLVREKGVKLMLVDYMQLMVSGGKHGNREGEISEISRSFKTLAKELKIPIIALAQLSRAVESRADKQPLLSDLRESGSIEQDADMVMFLYRAEYYGLDKDEDGNDTRGRARVIIAKHRNGPTGRVEIAFNAENTDFTDLNENPF